MSQSTYAQENVKSTGEDSSTTINGDSSVKSLSDTLLVNQVQKISKQGLDAEIQYKAKDSIVYAIIEKRIYLYGVAVIDYKDLHLESDMVVIDWDKNLISAKGSHDSVGKYFGMPVATESGREFRSDSMVYNFKTRKGKIYNLRMQEGTGYIQADAVKKDENDILYCKDASYTTCDAEHPHFYLQLTKAKIIPKEKVVSGPGYMVIEEIPIYFPVLPFGFFPTNEKKAKSGIVMPQYGYSKGRGYYLTNGGYYFAVSNKMDLTLTGDFYSYGSWGTGAKVRYKSIYKYSGSTEFKFNKNYFENAKGDFEPVNDFKIAWSHAQDPKRNPGFSFNSNVNIGSSSYNRNNSFNNDDIVNSRLLSSVSIGKTFGKSPFSLTGSLNHNQNLSDNTISLGLPKVNVSMQRVTPFSNIRSKNLAVIRNLGVTQNVNFDHSISTFDTLLFKGDSALDWKSGLDHQLQVSTSFSLFKYISINPGATFKGYYNFYENDWYYDSTANTVKSNRLSKNSYVYDYQFNTNLTTKLFGTYNFKKSKRLVAVRHVLTPSINLNYTPDFTTDKYGYFQDVATSSQPGSNGEIPTRLFSKYSDNPRGGPTQGKSGSVGLNLSNFFELKVKDTKDTAKTDATKKVSILDALDANTSYNFFADSLNLSDINLTARTNLFKKINIQSKARYSPYVIDTNSIKYNRFVWSEEGKLASLQSFNVNVSTGISQLLFKKKKSTASKSSAIAPKNSPNYRGYHMPFDIRLTYDYTVSKQKGNFIALQTLGISGNYEFTPLWKLDYKVNYDITNQKIGYSNFTLIRDLHCWQFSFNWTPTGTRKGFYFTMSAKASELKSLQLKKNQFFYDR